MRHQKKSKSLGENLDIVRRDGSPVSVRDLLVKTFLFVFYVGYFDLTNTIFSVFNCVMPDVDVSTLDFSGCNHASLSSYMQDKPWIYCSFSQTGPYTAMFILACIFLVVYVIGIPLLFAWLIYRNRAIIGNEEEGGTKEGHGSGGHLAYMNFLYDDYKSSFYWFELLWMGRRVILSVAVILLKEKNPFQPFLIIFVLSLSVAIELHLQPFRDRVENFLEICVLITLLYSYGGAVTSSLDTAFPIFILVLNGILLFVLVIAILRPWLTLFAKKLSRCCGCRFHRAKQRLELQNLNQLIT